MDGTAIANVGGYKSPSQPGHDDTSILIVLRAHGIAQYVPISFIVRAKDNEALARQAGATTVINPASFAEPAARRLGARLHIADCMADRAAENGRVAMRECPVAPEEVGRPLASIVTGLGLRVYCGTQPEDLIPEIVPRDQAGHGADDLEPQ